MPEMSWDGFGWFRLGAMPAGALHAQTEFATAYDPVRNRMIAFGGESDGEGGDVASGNCEAIVCSGARYRRAAFDRV